MSSAGREGDRRNEVLLAPPVHSESSMSSLADVSPALDDPNSPAESTLVDTASGAHRDGRIPIDTSSGILDSGDEHRGEAARRTSEHSPCTADAAEPVSPMRQEAERTNSLTIDANDDATPLGAVLAYRRL